MDIAERRSKIRKLFMTAALLLIPTACADWIGEARADAPAVPVGLPQKPAVHQRQDQQPKVKIPAAPAAVEELHQVAAMFVGCTACIELTAWVVARLRGRRYRLSKCCLIGAIGLLITAIGLLTENKSVEIGGILSITMAHCTRCALESWRWVRRSLRLKKVSNSANEPPSDADTGADATGGTG